jgi:NAD(P) transhydrogenase subunit alpha
MFSLIESFYILLLAGFVGFEVIKRVTPTLHTPLMSATNAISGISLVGSLVAAGSDQFVSQMLGLVAVTAATINVVGGFLITERMLKCLSERSGSSNDELSARNYIYHFINPLYSWIERTQPSRIGTPRYASC